jgi:tungstate transport system substrate-binding protein
LVRLIAIVLTLCTSLAAQAQDRFIVMASTTSTEQSGLFAHLLPAFKAASGIDMRVVAQGTGQALDTARRGDADVVFVHDQVAEEKFVADGFGVKRLPVMYNDFVIVGPKGDPAGARGKDVVAALEDRLQRPALRVARRQERHPCRRAALLEDGLGGRPGRRQAAPATRNAAVAWARH